MDNINNAMINIYILGTLVVISIILTVIVTIMLENRDKKNSSLEK